MHTRHAVALVASCSMGLFVGCRDVPTQQGSGNSEPGAVVSSVAAAAVTGGIFLEGTTTGTGPKSMILGQDTTKVPFDSLFVQFPIDTAKFLDFHEAKIGTARTGVVPGGVVNMDLTKKATGETHAVASVEASGPPHSQLIAISDPSAYKATIRVTTFAVNNAACKFEKLENLATGQVFTVAPITIDPAVGAYRAWFDCPAGGGNPRR